MKNDLNKFERDLLKSINFNFNKKFTHKNFMEWNTDINIIKNNLMEGEKIYNVLGCFVAINENI